KVGQTGRSVRLAGQTPKVGPPTEITAARAEGRAHVFTRASVRGGYFLDGRPPASEIDGRRVFVGVRARRPQSMALRGFVVRRGVQVDLVVDAFQQLLDRLAGGRKRGRS